MHLFSATAAQGVLSDCEEGVLAWVHREEIPALPQWEGDRLFLQELLENPQFFTMKLCYTGDRLTAAWKNGEPIDLPLVEYKLLCLFMQNPNHLMPREMILDRMWDGNGNFVDDNTLSVYIRRLRNKIEDTPNTPKYLLTERGIGYKWVVE